MCDCLDKLRTKLEARFGPIDFELKQTIDTETYELGVAIPPLYFTYHKKKANGQPEKKATRSYLTFTFCPFCGVNQSKPKEITTPTQGAKV